MWATRPPRQVAVWCEAEDRWLPPDVAAAKGLSTDAEKSNNADGQKEDAEKSNNADGQKEGAEKSNNDDDQKDADGSKDADEDVEDSKHADGQKEPGDERDELWNLASKADGEEDSGDEKWQTPVKPTKAKKTKVGNAAEDGQKDDAVAQKATTHDLEAFAADFCGVTDPNDKIFG